MFPTIKTTKRTGSLLFQLALAFAITSAVKVKNTDNTLTSCVYNYTQAPTFMQVGCSNLDLRCSGGTYIQIKSMHCGMTRKWNSYCDTSTPADCRAAQNCCAHHPADKSVKLRLKAEQDLGQICNDKDACRVAINVVSAIDYSYPRHYCLVTYNCRQRVSHVSKFTSTTDLYLNYNRTLPGNSQTESLTTDFPSTKSSQLELESTSVPVPAIVVPVIISLLILILVIGALLLRWKRNRGKSSDTTTIGRPQFTEQMIRDSRASNKYETIDISTVGSRRTRLYSPNSEDNFRNTLTAGSTCISTKGIDDISKPSPTFERVASPHLELETDDTYNHIDDGAKVDIKASICTEQMTSDRKDNIQRSKHNNGTLVSVQNDQENIYVCYTDDMSLSGNIKCRDSLSFNRQHGNYENVKLEEPASEINPYFILEQYDQYDHLDTVLPTGDACRTKGQSILDSEYNEIRFTKSAAVADPNYGVLCQDISPEAVENDITYSHIGDSVVRASAAFTMDYSYS